MQPGTSNIAEILSSLELADSNSGTFWGKWSPSTAAPAFVSLSPVNGQKIASVSAWTGGSTHAHIEHWKSLSGGYRYENMLDPMERFRSYA